MYMFHTFHHPGFTNVLPICHACSTGNTENFGAELLETLLKMAPTKEEEIKLREFIEDTSPIKLGPAEKFLKAVLDVPFAFKRVDAMLYIANFESEVNYLKKSFETLEVSIKASNFFFNLILVLMTFITSLFLVNAALL